MTRYRIGCNIDQVRDLNKSKKSYVYYINNYKIVTRKKIRAKNTLNTESWRVEPLFLQQIL